MIAVIFIAEIKELDEEYFEVAKKLRSIAIEKYGCLEFVSIAESKKEIAISYWPNESKIKKWKQDPFHLYAQKMGKLKWYNSYKVQVCKIVYEKS